MFLKFATAMVLASGTLSAPVFSHSFNAEAPGGYVPVEISMTNGTVGAGNTVTYRVVLAGAPTEDQNVVIGCTESGVYSSIPSSVTVPAGDDDVSFNATFASSLPSSWSTTATSMGKTVMVATIASPGIGK